MGAARADAAHGASHVRSDRLFGFDPWRHGHAQLFHQRHEVPVGPLLHDLRVVDSKDRGAGDGRLAMGRVHAQKVALVGAAGCPLDDDLIALRDGVIDGEAQIGKGFAATLDMVAHVLCPGREAGEHRIVKAAVARKNLRDHVELSMVPAVFDEAMDDLLIFFG